MEHFHSVTEYVAELLLLLQQMGEEAAQAHMSALAAGAEFQIPTLLPYHLAWSSDHCNLVSACSC